MTALTFPLLSILLALALSQLGKQEIIVKGVYHTYDTLKKSLELSLGDGTESILPAGLHE